MPKPPIPTGTVTFLFSDIEGSTHLLHKFGDRYPSMLNDHRAIFRRVLAEHEGYEISTEGDAFFVSFARAADGIASAVEIQRALAAHDWPEGGDILVRIGLHTGEPVCTGEDYTGLDVHRAARICNAGHGGQVLLSTATKILAGTRIPAGVTFRDLGEHRLKDLERPEHLQQLVIAGLRADFPLIRSLNNCPNNLPVQITPLIGREKQLAEVCELVRRPDVRFVTLCGPGGAGKTLLGLQAASALLADFADGAFVVDLASATDPNSVAVAIANVLGVEQAGKQPLSDRLIEHLRDKRLLLLLDNLEQVTSAARLLSLIIESCSQLEILGTSRAPLSVRLEYTYNVPPLEVPDLKGDATTGTLLASPAVRLFIERAKAVKGDFVINDQNLLAVVHICSRLDGLPLAIELAAARVKLLAPQALLARLVDPAGHVSLQLLTGGAHDLPARQQTMRDAIAWSYNLLEPDCKKLFCRLATFAGGCTLATAEEICREQSDLQIEVVDGIASLIDNHLLRYEEGAEGEPRISMLNTIREFGLEQLRKSRADAKAFRVHARHFATLAENAETKRGSSDYLTWTQRIEAEHDNFRSALLWSFENAPDLASGITASLGEYWFRQGHWTDLRTACEKIGNNGNGSSEFQARCIRYAGQCAQVTGDPARAEKLFEESLALSETVKSLPETLHALNRLAGIQLHHYGRIPEARSLLERAAAIANESDDESLRAETLFHESDIDLLTGDFDHAAEKLEQAAAIYRQRGDEASVAQCKSYLASVAMGLGEYERAYSQIEAALRIHEEFGEKYSALWDRFKRAQIASCRCEYTQARLELEECYKAFEQMSATVGEAWCLYELGKIALDAGELPEASSYFERALSIFRTLGKANAWALLQLGTTAIYEGRFRSARKLLDKALNIFREMSSKNGIAHTLWELARLSRLEADYTAAHAYLKESLDLIKKMESRRLAMCALEQSAYLAQSENKHDHCAILVGKVEALRTQMNSPLPPSDRMEYNEMVEKTRQALGDETFTKFWEQGKAATLEQFEP